VRNPELAGECVEVAEQGEEASEDLGEICGRELALKRPILGLFCSQPFGLQGKMMMCIRIIDSCGAGV